MAKLFCPILKDTCMGRECALAVIIDHPNVNPYQVLWQCGLLHDRDVERHGYSQVIDSERKGHGNA